MLERLAGKVEVKYEVMNLEGFYEVGGWEDNGNYNNHENALYNYNNNNLIKIPINNINFHLNSDQKHYSIDLSPFI